MRFSKLAFYQELTNYTHLKDSLPRAKAFCRWLLSPQHFQDPAAGEAVTVGVDSLGHAVVSLRAVKQL